MSKKNKVPTDSPETTITFTNGFTVVGLALADTMPIEFRGQIYDLANLSDEDAAHLLDHPDQVPFLQRIAPDGRD